MTIIPFLSSEIQFYRWSLARLTGREYLKIDSVFFVLDKVTSIFRDIPFIILPVLINPLLGLLWAGIGPTAACALSLAVFPFFARQVQVVLSELGPRWS